MHAIPALRLVALGALLLLSACDSGHAGSPPESAVVTPAASPSPAADSTPSDASAPALPSYPAPDAEGRVRLTEDEWRARLSPEQFRILRRAGTERPFSSALNKKPARPGHYHCAGCGLALFHSTDKFDSGTGWPSFTRPAAPGRVLDHPDNSYGMIRVENLCYRCEGHLGHVFPDGPEPTGLRYCINGDALVFIAEAAPDAAQAQP